MTRVRLWFARAVMLYALLIFAYLGALYFIEPQAHIARFGVSISGAPESLNFVRTGPGAMFVALAVTALYGLVRRQHLLACLWFVVLLNACVVAGRIYGIATEGVDPLQLSELRDEGLSWISFVAALIVCPRAVQPAG
jgi:hypothetical protein